jgi:hypothetical protein
VASADISDSTALGRSLLTAETASAARTELGLTIGTNVPPGPVVQTWDGASNVTVAPTTTVLRMTTQNAANRTITLPAISAYPVGTPLMIDLGVGVANNTTITLQRAGTDVIHTTDGFTATTYSLGQAKGLFVLMRSSATQWTPDNVLRSDIFGGILTDVRFVNGFLSGGNKVIGLPADYFVAWANGTGNYFSHTSDTRLSRNAAGVVQFGTTANNALGSWRATNGTLLGTLTGTEQLSAPAAPAANGYVIYAEDNGSGKTRLMVRFATGAAQQIAIEP